MTIAFRLDLAPIQGVTHAPFRRAYRRAFSGLDRDFAPFIRIHPDGRTPRGGKNRLAPYAPDAPLVPQALSNDPEELLAFDRWVAGLGYPEFNWNLGCPERMVALKQRGSGLLPHPERVAAILERVLPALTCRLSIKLRLGWEDPREILALLPVLNRLRPAELIVHPRTGAALYEGRPDLETFAEVLRRTDLPVAYNGDIFTLADFETLRERFPGVRGWMLGRGVLANPFLPLQLRGQDPGGDRLERWRRFHGLLAEAWSGELQGPTHLADKLKEFWRYARFGFEGGPEFFRRARRARRAEEFLGAVETFFAGRPVVREHLDVASAEFGN